MEDVVVESYKRQIKECNVNADTLKVGGFDIIVKYLDDHGVDTSRLKSFFKQIELSKTLDDINMLTMDELLSIIDDINHQVTRELISQVELGDYILRRTNFVAHEKSLTGEVKRDNRYLVIGTNLSSVVMKSGIAEAIKICIKQYCNQKIYQANYREKLVEREKQLGIFKDEDEEFKRKEEIKKKFEEEVRRKLGESTTEVLNQSDDILYEIFGHSISFDVRDFNLVKDEYYDYFNNRLSNINKNN